MEQARRLFFKDGFLVFDSGGMRGDIIPFEPNCEFEYDGFIDVSHDFLFGNNVKAVKQDLLTKELIIERFTESEIEAKKDQMDKMLDSVLRKEIDISTLLKADIIKMFIRLAQRYGLL